MINKLRLRDSKCLLQSHTATKWLGRDVNPAHHSFLINKGPGEGGQYLAMTMKHQWVTFRHPQGG